MTDPSGTTTYNYDNRNRLLSKATPFGTLSYTYDAANLLTITSSNLNGAAMTYSYDTLNRLSTVKDASGTTTYNYDPVGNLASFIYPNGVQHSYTYDPQNRLTQMGATCGTAVPGCAAGTQLSSYTYTLGAAGNRLSVAELSGRNVSYGYDDLYRLTSESITCAVATPNCTTQKGSIGYTYDNVGNRLNMTSSIPAIPPGQFNFDANDRLTTDNYDPDGNTISSGGILNSYDFENHLIKHGNITIVYDGDGNRVSETVGGVTTNYLVAAQNPTSYAQVVEELQNGTVVRTYSYGLERISETQSINGTVTTSFYGYDGHGSVRQVFSNTGAITDAYDYEAFGSLVSSTGTTPNNYLFVGEQFDAALGLYYNRARYLDTNTGRFWSMDPALGRSRKPSSFHHYIYGSQNPANVIDPTGLEDADIATNVATLADNQVLTAVETAQVAQLVASVAEPEVVAEAPAAFGFFAKAIAWLSIGTIAFGSVAAATSSGGAPSGVPIDEAVALANSNNYDIYRFGSATGGIRSPRIVEDYDLNSRNLIDPQSFNLNFTYKGASAFRDPRASGLTGVVYRAPLPDVEAVDGLSVVADGKDVIPSSPHPIGHHTIFPTVEMSPTDFDQRLRSIPWVRVPGRIN